MRISVFLIVVFFCAGSLFAQEEKISEKDIKAIERITMRAEDILGEVDTSFSILDPDFVVEELVGKVAEINNGYFLISLPQGKDIKMVIDAETLIFINEKKSSPEDVIEGDDIFAYYVEEGGIFKCDWVDIER